MKLLLPFIATALCLSIATANAGAGGGLCSPSESGVAALKEAVSKFRQVKDVTAQARKPTKPLSECNTSNPTLSPNEGLKEERVPGSEICPAGMVVIKNLGPFRIHDVAGKVEIQTFCIDQFEAALVEDLPGGVEQHFSPYHDPKQKKLRAVSIKGAVPQTNISGPQAAQACRQAGKRLCSDIEWQRACVGPNDTPYPYGSEREDGLCNDSRPGWAPGDAFRNSPPDLLSPCINQVTDAVAKAGEYEHCRTPEGVYDLMGNVHEWTGNAKELSATEKGIFRGGYHSDTSKNGQGCYYKTTRHAFGYGDYSIGFRCCAGASAK